MLHLVDEDVPILDQTRWCKGSRELRGCRRGTGAVNGSRPMFHRQTSVSPTIAKLHANSEAATKELKTKGSLWRDQVMKPNPQFGMQAWDEAHQKNLK